MNNKLEGLEKTEGKLRDAEGELKTLRSTTDEQKGQISKFHEKTQENGALLKKVLASIREHGFLIKANSELIDEKKFGAYDRTSEVEADSESQTKKFKFEETCKEIPKDISCIFQWAQDQMMLLHTFLSDRDKLVQLNLKVNQLKKKNSLLSIDNDKQKLMIEKYKSSVVF